MGEISIRHISEEKHSEDEEQNMQVRKKLRINAGQNVELGKKIIKKKNKKIIREE
jgi:hypothetical protein